MLQFSRDQYKAAYSSEDPLDWISWNMSFGYTNQWYYTTEVNSYNESAYFSWLGGDDHAAVYDLIQAVQAYINGETGLNYPDWGLLSGNLTVDAMYMCLYQAQIDWKAIMSAWFYAPLAGWGWTIQFIDFMRKAVWDEPMDIIEQENWAEI